MLIGVDSYADNGRCDLPAHFRRVDFYQEFLDRYTGDSPPAIDAGVTAPDAGTDGGSDDGGCSAGGAASWPLALGLALVLARRRRSLS